MRVEGIGLIGFRAQVLDQSYSFKSKDNKEPENKSDLRQVLVAATVWPKATTQTPEHPKLRCAARLYHVPSHLAPNTLKPKYILTARGKAEA